MEQVFAYIIQLGASVMMPILFTIIGLCIGMKFGKSLKSGLYVGVGFVGFLVQVPKQARSERIVSTEMTASKHPRPESVRPAHQQAPTLPSS